MSDNTQMEFEEQSDVNIDDIFDNVIMEDFDQPEEPTNEDNNDNEQHNEPEEPKPKKITKRQQTPRPANKSKKQTVSQHNDDDDNIEQIYKSVEVPTKDEFVNSYIIQTILWLIKNAHKDEDKLGKILTGKKEKKDVENITPTTFKNVINKLYNDFAFLYKLHTFGNMIDKNKYKLTKDYLKVNKKKQTIFTVPNYTADDYKTHDKEFKLTMTTLWMNIDFNKLTFKQKLSLVKLPIFSTSNAYDINSYDFDKFKFSYDDKTVSFDDFNITNEQKTIMYRSIFTKTTISKPYLVFNNRASFSYLIDDETIDENIKSCLEQFDNFNYEEATEGMKSKPTEEETNDIIELLTYMFKSETFKNIIFKSYIPNVIIKDVLNSVFKTKSFKLLLDNCLSSVNYLFGPYSFWNNGLSRLMDTKKQKQSLQNRHKLMINYLLTTEDIPLFKNNQWWVAINVDSSCLNNIEDPWLWNNNDTEAKQQRLNKQTNKNQTKKTTDKPPQSKQTNKNQTKKTKEPPQADNEDEQQHDEYEEDDVDENLENYEFDVDETEF